MAEPLTLEVLTPHRRVLSCTTAWVTVPGTVGELGILPQHVPLVTTMDTGILQYEENGQAKRAAVHYGYAQVQGRHVTVLALMVEVGVHIDRRRAQNAERRAREQLNALMSEQADARSRLDKAQAKLQRAMVRMQASQ